MSTCKTIIIVKFKKTVQNIGLLVCLERREVLVFPFCAWLVKANMQKSLKLFQILSKLRSSICIILEKNSRLAEKHFHGCIPASQQLFWRLITEFVSERWKNL